MRWGELTSDLFPEAVQQARAFAKSIRAIKDDTETKRLQDEFFGRIGQQ